MAFEKLTLFEFDVEDATFGPRFSGDEPSPVTEGGDVDAEGSPDLLDTTVMGATQSDGASNDTVRGTVRRFLVLVGVSVVLSVVATVLARRLFGDDEQTTVDEFTTDDTHDVQVEQTAE